VVMTGLLAAPTIRNYIGVRSRASLSSILAAVKLLPLGLLIAGVMCLGGQARIIPASEIKAPGWRSD
jgi:hypothetical protein